MESREVLSAHAYLVSRGVRPLALVGHVVDPDDLSAIRVTTALADAAEAGAIPFTCTTDAGTLDYGYAGKAWAADLYRWVNENQDAVPEVHRHRIIGLLLGYDPAAVRDFEELNSSGPQRVTGWREPAGR